jgi:hypothetical protein
MNKQIILMALAAVAIGCSSDSASLAGPDPKQCNKGSISPGDSKSGQLGSASCLRYDFAYSQDSVYYDSYTFTAVKGHGYMFALENADHVTRWDAVLELATTNPNTGEEQLLAISDDEGGNNYSRLYFIAPVSGTFTLRASGYDKPDTAAYSLTAKSCDSPLPQIAGSLDSTSQTLATSDCTLAQPAFGNDSTHVKLYSIHIGPNESKTITVTSSDFAPGFQMYGPAWGVPCDYRYQGCGEAIAPVQMSNVASASITAGGNESCSHGTCQYSNWPGDYTLAVGSTSTSQTGAFSLKVSSTIAPPPPQIVAGSVHRDYTPVLEWLAKKPLRAKDYLRRVR